MDSSNAEKAWEKYSAVHAPAKLLSMRDWYAARATFMAGAVSRDAEVEELERQIQGWVKSATEAKDAHRAEVGVLREQLAAAEAVIEKVRGHLREVQKIAQGHRNRFQNAEAERDALRTQLAALRSGTEGSAS